MPNKELIKFANPVLEIRAIEWGFNNNKWLGRTYLNFWIALLKLQVTISVGREP